MQLPYNLLSVTFLALSAIATPARLTTASQLVLDIEAVADANQAVAKAVIQADGSPAGAVVCIDFFFGFWTRIRKQS